MSDRATRPAGWRAWAREVAQGTRWCLTSYGIDFLLPFAWLVFELVEPGLMVNRLFRPAPEAAPPGVASGLVLVAFAIGVMLLDVRGQGHGRDDAPPVPARFGAPTIGVAAAFVAILLWFSLLGLRGAVDALLAAAGVPPHPDDRPFPHLGTTLAATLAALPAAAAGAALGAFLGRRASHRYVNGGLRDLSPWLVTGIALGILLVGFLPERFVGDLVAVPVLGLAWVPALLLAGEPTWSARVGLALSIAVTPVALVASARLSGPPRVVPQRPEGQAPLDAVAAEREAATPRTPSHAPGSVFETTPARLAGPVAWVVLGAFYMLVDPVEAAPGAGGQPELRTFTMRLVSHLAMLAHLTVRRPEATVPVARLHADDVPRPPAEPWWARLPGLASVATAVGALALVVTALYGAPTPPLPRALGAATLVGLGTLLAATQAVAMAQGPVRLAARAGVRELRWLWTLGFVFVAAVVVRVVFDRRLEEVALSPFVPFVGTAALFDVTAFGPLPWAAIAAQTAWAGLGVAVLSRLAPPASLGADDGGAA